MERLSTTTIEGDLSAGDSDYSRATIRSAGTLIAAGGHIELPTKPRLGFDLIESESKKTKHPFLIPKAAGFQPQRPLC